MNGRFDSSTTAFEPPEDYRLGIRGGPLLPSAVRARLSPAIARDIITGEPGQRPARPPPGNVRRRLVGTSR